MATHKPTLTQAPPAPETGAPLDGCPQCVIRDNPATEARWGHEGGIYGVTATYRCRKCGHVWTTSWAMDEAGER